MRNVPLYEALCEYCKSALALLETRIGGPKDIPTVGTEKFEFSEDGSLVHIQSTEVLWYMLISKNEQDLTQGHAYPAATKALEEDAEIAEHLDTLVGTDESRTRVDAKICLWLLLARLLQQQQDMTFHEPVFSKVYNEFEDYFHRDATEYRFLAPLNSFRAEAEKIELGPGFSIIKMPGEERAEILSRSRQLFGVSFYPFVTFHEYGLELYLKVQKVIGEGSPTPKERNIPSQIARKQFDEACSALRLFKSGAVSYDLVRAKPTSWELHGSYPLTSLIVTRPSVGTPYALSKKEIPDFLQFWSSFQKARKRTRRRIDVALRRFNFAYERVRPEDRLIDYLIGFEALLLLEGERQELEYRLALRGCVLLGKTEKGRKAVFQELKTAYRERSNIVHGGLVKDTVKIGDDKTKFNDFVDRVEQHLRSAIKESLARSETRSESEVIKDLDEKIVGSS